MNDVTILTHQTCSYCHAAKNLLRQQGIDYQEVDLIEGGEEAAELLQRSGGRTVPQVFIDQNPIGGYTELSEIIANNALI